MTSKIQGITHQQGAALVVSLIMLLLMTLVGVTAMQVTMMQEKMVANSRDINTAFQAAETALKRGELYARIIYSYVTAAGTYAEFSADCSVFVGLCQPSCSTYKDSVKGSNDWCTGDTDPKKTPAQWLTVDWEPSSKNTLEYGNEKIDNKLQLEIDKTHNISPLPDGSVAWQPRFIIEKITMYTGGEQKEDLYRITAQGYGQAQSEDGQPLGRVTLQSIIKLKKSSK